MAFHQGFVPLRDILAELYPAPGLARTVVAEAGIAEQLIDFGGAAVEFWQAILTVADNQARVQTLIEVAHRHFPQNERLIEAIKQYHATPVGAAAPFAPLATHTSGVNFTNSTVTIAGNVTGGNNTTFIGPKKATM